jgi:LacI family transcriptional regulator
MPESAGTGSTRGRVTIGHVAAMAGVSPTTVSHVFSGKRLVGAATRERVEEAVRALDYRPSNVARNLRTRRSHMVAVIVPDLTNHFYSVLTRGLADSVDAVGYGTYVCNTDALLDREHKFVQDVLDRGVDGVVIAPVDAAPGALSRSIHLGTPVVCLGDRIDLPEVDRVIADDENGSRAATAHLLAAGATRVAMIRGPSGAGTSRISGYRRAVEEAGGTFVPELAVDGRWTRQGGREAMARLMDLEPRPDGVFCANDLMAIGAMDTARSLGLRIPDDVALAGFDDVEAASLVTPALTTVENPAYATGCEAARLLLSRMRGEYDGERRTVVLDCTLVERESG